VNGDTRTLRVKGGRPFHRAVRRRKRRRTSGVAAAPRWFGAKRPNERMRAEPLGGSGLGLPILVQIPGQLAMRREPARRVGSSELLDAYGGFK
jgi:hypothetical protein